MNISENEISKIKDLIARIKANNNKLNPDLLKQFKNLTLAK
jgi:hypothetical protein